MFVKPELNNTYLVLGCMKTVRDELVSGKTFFITTRMLCSIQTQMLKRNKISSIDIEHLWHM